MSRPKRVCDAESLTTLLKKEKIARNGQFTEIMANQAEILAKLNAKPSRGTPTAEEINDEIAVLGNMNNCDVIPAMRIFDFRKLFISSHPAFGELIDIYDSDDAAKYDRMKIIVSDMFQKGKLRVQGTKVAKVLDGNGKRVPTVREGLLKVVHYVNDSWFRTVDPTTSGASTVEYHSRVAQAALLMVRGLCANVDASGIVTVGDREELFNYKQFLSEIRTTHTNVNNSASKHLKKNGALPAKRGRKRTRFNLTVADEVEGEEVAYDADFSEIIEED